MFSGTFPQALTPHEQTAQQKVGLDSAYEHAHEIPLARVFLGVGSILVSGFAFGLVQPGAKFFLGTGISLLPFCLFYVGLRFAYQFPVALGSHALAVSSWTKFRWLLLFGLVGAGLRLTENWGIAVGLAVPVVSFLVYSHPVWTILICRLAIHQPITKLSVFRMSLAIVGIALITELQFASIWGVKFIGPLTAGLLVACWIYLSTSLQKKGLNAITLSFYYDFFSFIALLVLCLVGLQSIEWQRSMAWFLEPHHFFWMNIFALLTGVLPNYIFYYGARNVAPVTAALILLFEPIFASVVSCLIWRDSISINFVVGASCILLINTPAPTLYGLARSIRSTFSGLFPSNGKIYY